MQLLPLLAWITATLYFIFIILFLAYIGIKLRNKNNLLTRLLQEIPRKNWEAVSLVSHLNPKLPLPKPGGWAASSDFLIELVKLIETTKPKLVVELGSGLSTLVTAYALRKAGGGKVVSFDHEESYALKTQAQIIAHGLGDIADVRTAPLSKQEGISGELPWYELSAISDIRNVDFLIVDGPPKSFGGTVRGPAVEIFRECFSKGATIILDDANRPGEKEIVRQWRGLLPGWSFKTIPLQKGMVIARNDNK